MAQRTFPAGCEGGPDLWGLLEEGCGGRKPGQSTLNPEELGVTITWEKHKRERSTQGHLAKRLGSLPLCFSITESNTHIP